MHFVTYPYLQMPTSDGITVMWQTDEVGSTELEVWDAFCPACGKAEYSPQGQPRLFSGEPGAHHRAQAQRLTPGRDYCYRATTRSGSATAESEISVFRTAPAEGAPLSFAVTSEFGGAGSPPRVLDALADSMTAERPDFLLLVGDMVRDGRRPQDWDECMFAPLRALLGNTPFFHCAGNHEEHADHMARLLGTPEGYYDFTYGCAHFVALDTTRLSDHVERPMDNYVIEPTVPLDERDPQVRFLSAALAGSRAPWKFVFLHYPPYFSGTWEAPALRPLCAIFERFGVDIVFTSHAIVYERSHPIADGKIDFERGVRYIVAGGAGARPDWFHHKKAWHTARSRAVPHFLHLSITPTHLELQAIDLEGRMFDTLTLDKR